MDLAEWCWATQQTIPAEPPNFYREACPLEEYTSVQIIKQQIADLNQKVIDYCVPIVTSNVKQYLHYRKDVSSLPEPMAYGLATSQAGSRSLELKPFV